MLKYVSKYTCGISIESLDFGIKNSFVIDSQIDLCDCSETVYGWFNI